MATTWMKALHRSGGIAAALGRSTDYISNPDKTNDGELIEGYECDPFTVQSEFLLSKRLYAQKTGRDQGGHDVIAYHIRQSFKPGEVTAQQALAIGRELALRWTKGKHQFIVAAHTNTANPHTHIIFNSVDLDCTHKFEDFKRSAIALRRVSDQICLEHGLSIIEKPGLSKGYNRAEYLGGAKAPSMRERLRELFDASLQDCKSFDNFLAAMKSAGCDVKRGKHLAFKIPDGKKFIRCNSLGNDYVEPALLERISGKRVASPISKSATPVVTATKPNLLIDIQAKIQQGYGVGFEKWARLQNLKEASRTLIFLQENGLDDYDELARRTADVTAVFDNLSAQIKAAESRMEEIAALQKHIGAYSKTLDVYRQYKKSGYNKQFYEAHITDLMLHRAAKKHFDSLGLAKLPTINLLKQEYATLLAHKKKLYSSYKVERETMRALLTAKQNVDCLLGTVPAREKDRAAEQVEQR